eukprot:TRINITY_DN80977_c0_g1_i1.p1 TRINITY_DN80977_c0_g1~~TRINITY_DN80977_c0_g1_i1.p1  ORF type:complete len:743 (+),score=143.43 TRINITY_DN80977_c0_g1_i1:24-2252(+)
MQRSGVISLHPSLLILVLSETLATTGVAPWATGRWFDASPYFNLPVTICKRARCSSEGDCKTRREGCRKGWQAYHGQCYLLIDRGSVFSQAVERCKEHDAVLVSIWSSEENAFVQHLCGNRFCWLGLQELPGSESWRWLDGSDASYGAYTNWAPGEPNNFADIDESVAVLNFNDKEMFSQELQHGAWALGLWYDVPKDFDMPKVICEHASSNRSSTLCRAGWELFRGSCYKLLEWHSTWDDAQDRCQESGSHMVTVSNAAEQAFVKRLCGKNMCWLGLREHPESEYWFWVDETPLSFENWEEGEPNNFGRVDESRACMNMHLREALMDQKVWKPDFKSLMAEQEEQDQEAAESSSIGLAPWADGKWYDTASYLNIPVTICKAPAPCVMSRAGCGDKEEDNLCDAGWQAFKQQCYKLIDRGSEFKRAVQRCRDHGAFLVSITSAAENEFVQKICGNRFCWLGLGQQANSATWQWLDGSSDSASSYSNWQTGEPNNFQGRDENVVIMNFNMREAAAAERVSWVTGTWYDVPGDLSLPKVICEMPMPKAGCKHDWQAFGTSCYSMLDGHCHFADAQQRCLEEDATDGKAHLVTIASAAEQEYVQRLCGRNMCWLGLLEHPKSESWYWIDMSPLEYQNWEYGEPNNYGAHDENRAVMNMNIRYREGSPTEEERDAAMTYASASVVVIAAIFWLGRLAAYRRSTSSSGLGGTEPQQREGDSCAARSPALLEPVLETQEAEPLAEEAE